MPRTDSQQCRRRKERERIRKEQKRLYDKFRCQTNKYRAKERERYHASTIANGRQPHLYILKYEETMPGCFKIGRTGDFANRLKDLNCGHLARVRYVAQYPNLGHLELLIHDELAPYRAPGGSREWFEVGVEHIDDTIRSLAGEDIQTSFCIRVTADCDLCGSQWLTNNID